MMLMTKIRTHATLEIIFNIFFLFLFFFFFAFFLKISTSFQNMLLYAFVMLFMENMLFDVLLFGLFWGELKKIQEFV